jgi:hypothetical protein
VSVKGALVRGLQPDRQAAGAGDGADNQVQAQCIPASCMERPATAVDGRMDTPTQPEGLQQGAAITGRCVLPKGQLNRVIPALSLILAK